MLFSPTLTSVNCFTHILHMHILHPCYRYPWINSIGIWELVRNAESLALP